MTESPNESGVRPTEPSRAERSFTRKLGERVQSNTLHSNPIQYRIKSKPKAVSVRGRTVPKQTMYSCPVNCIILISTAQHSKLQQQLHCTSVLHLLFSAISAPLSPCSLLRPPFARSRSPIHHRAATPPDPALPKDRTWPDPTRPNDRTWPDPAGLDWTAQQYTKAGNVVTTKLSLSRRHCDSRSRHQRQLLRLFIFFG